jgi:hypothetical protein
MSEDQNPAGQQQPAGAGPAAFTEESVIKLNDQEYRYGDLSENARQLINALQASEQQMQNVRNQLGLMDIGRRALAAQLRVAIENPEALQQAEDDRRDG